MKKSDFHPSHADAKSFLDLLEPDGTFWFQIKGESADSSVRPGYFPGTLAQHWDRLLQLNQNGAAIWVQVNAATGRRDTEVTQVRAYFVDLDGNDPKPLLSHESGADILVESSPGKFHGYWLAGNVPLESFKPRQQALAARFGGDRAVCNLARVMRLPGMYHHKATPFRTKLIKPASGD